MPVADLFLIVSVYCVANQVVHFESTVILYMHKNAKAKKWNISFMHRKVVVLQHFIQ